MTFPREVRPPGLYAMSAERVVGPLQAADTGIAGFVGLALRGPLDEPRRLARWNDFVELYGAGGDGYLARAVEGFFLNGGRACHVVRIAHRAPPGAHPGAEHAAAAERVVRDRWDKPTLVVRACNEGRWGNALRFGFRRTVTEQALLTLHLDVGRGEAQVSAVRGFARGSLVRISDGQHEDHVVLAEVDEEARVLRWSRDTPVVHAYRSAGPTHLELIDLELSVSLKDRREIFRGLQLSTWSPSYIARLVNERSMLVRIEELRSPSPPPYHLPAEGLPVRLVGGRDGAEAVTADDFIGWDHGPGDRRGLASLEALDEVAILAVPDAVHLCERRRAPEAEWQVARVQQALVEQCERRRDRFVLLDMPPLCGIDEVRRWRRHRDSSYAAFYHPWLRLADDACVPPSGHVAGVLARVAGQVGCHKAPANEVVIGAQDVTLAFQDDHLGLLNGDGVNPLRQIPGRGVRVWGARTASDDAAWRYVNVRRLFIFLRRSIGEGTAWTVFEPHHEKTWGLVARQVSQFLEAQWKKGALRGAHAEEAFFVKCDAETNPPEQGEQGRLVIEVGVAPTMPAEFILFTVTHHDRASAGAVADGGAGR